MKVETTIDYYEDESSVNEWSSKRMEITSEDNYSDLVGITIDGKKILCDGDELIRAVLNALNKPS